jgi:hypothetical protein
VRLRLARAAECDREQVAKARNATENTRVVLTRMKRQPACFSGSRRGDCADCSRTDKKKRARHAGNARSEAIRRSTRWSFSICQTLLVTRWTLAGSSPFSQSQISLSAASFTVKPHALSA